jgi:LysM repeat protein
MGVSVRDITEANQLKSILIHPGDDLLIPSPAARGSKQPVQSAVASVRSGDSAWVIASRYGVGLSELLAANDLGSSDLIHPGQLLKLPTQPSGDAQITHEVQSGDSLYDIAIYYGVGLTDLRAWNALGGSNLIRPGDELTIWLGAGS